MSYWSSRFSSLFSSVKSMSIPLQMMFFAIVDSRLIALKGGFFPLQALATACLPCRQLSCTTQRPGLGLVPRPCSGFANVETSIDIIEKIKRKVNMIVHLLLYTSGVRTLDTLIKRLVLYLFTALEPNTQ